MCYIDLDKCVCYLAKDVKLQPHLPFVQCTRELFRELESSVADSLVGYRPIYKDSLRSRQVLYIWGQFH